jgi:preprotein translocase subunit SecF
MVRLVHGGGAKNNVLNNMKRHLNIIGYRRVGYIFSGVLVAFCLVALAVWGLRLGIDFTGGSLIEIEYTDARPTLEEVKESIPTDFGTKQVTPVGDSGYIIRMMNLTDEQHQSILNALPGDQDKIIENRFTSIGPTIGVELRNNSVYALIAVLVAILIYVALAFRKVSHPVPSWQYGAAGIVALFHDVIITLGIFAALGHFIGVEIDALFITALLTVLGFSVHDTIVVFDRVRDNLHRMEDKRFPTVVNTSLNETMSRSINTSFTTLLVLLFSLFFGGSTITFFVLALVIGIVFGTYSSIFIASPLLVSLFTWHEKRILSRQ